MRASFPPDVVSHSREQDFYLGEDFLLRRHDYHVEVAGGFAAANYVYDFAQADGIRLPTKILPNDELLRPLRRATE